MSAWLAAVLCSCASARPQDGAIENRRFDVEFLTGSVPDHPGQPVGLARDENLWADKEDLSGRTEADRILEILRRATPEGGWNEAGVGIRFEDGALLVAQRRPVLDRIAGILASWRRLADRRIAVDALVVTADLALYRRLRGEAPPGRPAALSPENARALVSAARRGQGAEILASGRMLAHPGQRLAFQDLRKTAYVSDYDVQIGTAAVTADPIVDVLATGTSVDVRSWLDPLDGRVTLQVRFDATGTPTIGERAFRLHREVFPTADPPGRAAPVDFGQDVKIQLPRYSHDAARTTVTAATGETVVAAAILRDGRMTAFLLTPSVIEEPAPGVSEEVRLYDVSALIRPHSHFAGPRIDVTSPLTGLAGRFSDVPEPRARATIEDLSLAIRPAAGAGDGLPAVEEGTLFIRPPVDGRAAVETILRRLQADASRTITVETLVVAFPRAARAEWEKRIPALAAADFGVEPDAVRALLEAAAEGRGARLLAWAESTAFAGQRVHARRLDVQSYLQDIEPQVSSNALEDDPIIGRLETGFVHDVEARLDGPGRLRVNLRASLLDGGLVDAPPGGRTGFLQQPRVSQLRWEAVADVRGDRWTLVGQQSAGRGEAAEEIALLLRARADAPR